MLFHYGGYPRWSIGDTFFAWRRSGCLLYDTGKMQKNSLYHTPNSRLKRGSNKTVGYFSDWYDRWFSPLIWPQKFFVTRIARRFSVGHCISHRNFRHEKFLAPSKFSWNLNRNSVIHIRYRKMLRYTISSRAQATEVFISVACVLFFVKKSIPE